MGEISRFDRVDSFYLDIVLNYTDFQSHAGKMLLLRLRQIFFTTMTNLCMSQFNNLPMMIRQSFEPLDL
jgi:hypothetical protein